MRAGLVALAVIAGWAAPAGADVPHLPLPPSGFDAKRPLDPDDLRRKNQRGYVTGLPLANFDPNTGFGAGVRGYYYWNGRRDDPLFAYTPYLHRVFAQAFFTTGGLQFHWLDYDAPAIGGSSFRLRSQLIYMRNTQQHFFGIGDRAMQPLTFTGAGQSFDRFGDYDDALQMVRPDGSTLARYDDYDVERPIALISLERTFLRGLVRPLFGIGWTHADVDDYTGKQVEAIGPTGDTVMATMGPTRLAEQCDAGLLVGCDGGWEGYLRFGLSLDNRDFEPDPNNGFFADLSLDLATRLVGSDYDFARFLLAGRYYVSPIPRIADLVLALRGTFQVQSKDTPFFTVNTISYTEDSRSGLGGHRTLRGFQQDRFMGRVVTFANAELRWTYHRFQVLKQKIALMIAPFVDTGRAYDRVADLSFRGWRTGYGAGLRLSWNLATVIVVDYGRSAEDSGVYINFNHQF